MGDLRVVKGPQRQQDPQQWWRRCSQLQCSSLRITWKML